MRAFSGYVVSLLAVQLLIACGNSESASDAAVPQETVEAPAPGKQVSAEEADLYILAFGDSLYAGYQLDPGDGFAPELQNSLQEAGLNAFVQNAGVSGDTTAGGLRRMEYVLDQSPKKPDLVVLGLGANDLLRGIDIRETRANLTAMLDILKQRGIPVVMTGMIAPDNMGSEFVGDFKAIYNDLSSQYDAPLYPFFLDGVITKPDLMLEDGIHPNAQGVDQIVERVAPLVEQALQKTG